MRHQVRSQVGLALLIAGVVMATGVGARSQPSGRQPAGTRFTFAEGRLSFVAPPGFTALSAEELAAKYPRAGAPRSAVGNARRTTSIAYDLLDQRAPSEDLEAARAFFASTYEKAFPKLKWIANDVRQVGGRKWTYLEFTAPAADQDLHNIVLVSVHDGRILMFNFNSTVEEFPRVEQALRGSMTTVAPAP